MFIYFILCSYRLVYFYLLYFSFSFNLKKTKENTYYLLQHNINTKVRLCRKKIQIHMKV